MKLAKSFRRAQIIWSASGITLLLVMAAFVWWVLAREAREVAVATQMSGIEPRDINSRDAPPSPEKSRKHSHLVSPALQLVGPEYLEMRDRWFEPPTFTNAQHFSPTTTPLVIDASCAHRAEMQRGSLEPTLESSIRRTVGIDTAQLIPLDALVQQVSQFWQHAGWFYQLSVRWEKDIPATYRIEYFRTRQADFQGVVERLSMPDSDPLDMLSAAAKLDETLTEAESRGAVQGARLVHLLLGGEEGDSMQDLKISNGRPIAWMFGNGHCRARNDGTAFCRCIDPTTASKEQKDEHRVID